MSLNETVLAQVVQALQSVTSRLENLEKRMTVASLKGSSPRGAASSPSGSAPAAAAADEMELPASVTEYEELLRSYFDPIVALASEIGGDVKIQTQGMYDAFKAVRDVVAVASLSKKPSNEEFSQLVQPVVTLAGKIAEFNADKRSPDFNMLNAVKEGGSMAVYWLGADPTPLQHLKDALDQFLFYGNRARTEFREKDPKRAEWVIKNKELFEQLSEYVKKHHKAGLSWNPRGGSIAEAKQKLAGGSTAAPAAEAKSGSAPPPPPPRKGDAPAAAAAAAPDADTGAKRRGGPAAPPPPVLEAVNLPEEKSGGGSAALFAEINSKSEGITSGLKHVTKEQKTKYRTDAPPPVAPSQPKPKAAAASARGKEIVRGPPEILIEGYKVFVRNFVDDQTVELKDLTIKHAIMISNCVRSVVQVHTKVNSISVANCERTGVVAKSVMGSIEIVNCDRSQVQITESVPIVQVDSSTGLQLFMPEECASNVNIITSKSAELNLSVVINDGDDLVERAIPEQFVTTYKSGKLTTVPNSHLG